MNPQPDGTSFIKSIGQGAVAVGQVAGDIIMSLFAGDATRFVGDVKKWSIWNWPPFFLVLAMGAVALIRLPEGPTSQFAAMCLLLGLGVVATGWRVVGMTWSAPWRAFVSVVSVGLAVSGLVVVEHLREHGVVDVTGRSDISPAGPVSDAAALTVAVEGAPGRDHLRLVLSVDDAVPEGQTCTPETSLSVAPADRAGGSTVTGVRSGEAVDLPLGGSRDEVRVRVVVHTDQGCRMTVAVADAELYD